MRRFVVVAAVTVMAASGANATAFADTHIGYAAAGVVQWGETYQDEPGNCGTSFYQLNIVVAVRTEGRQWQGGVGQKPYYENSKWVPCGTADPNNFPGIWVTGSFSNPATGEVVNAAGTCGGSFGPIGLDLTCHLTFDGVATTLYLAAPGGDVTAECASAGLGYGCNYTAPAVGVRAEQD